MKLKFYGSNMLVGEAPGEWKYEPYELHQEAKSGLRSV